MAVTVSFEQVKELFERRKYSGNPEMVVRMVRWTVQKRTGKRVTTREGERHACERGDETTV